MSHTPGPWTASHEGTSIVLSSLGPIAIVATGTIALGAYSSDKIRSNAALISAAPDLLAACEVALNDRMYKEWPDVADILTAAIAKAEGK